MARMTRWFLTALAALVATTAFAQAPDRAPAFSRAELDQVLAPIALYPDTLLSQVLAASTYPRDVAEAASWVRVHGLRGEEAVRAAEERDWDPNVVALTAFPEVLTMLDARRDWAARLADAFMYQAPEVMDAVQELRARADEAGTLRTSEQMVVQRQGGDYVIEPPAPEYLYVPYYDPREAYGAWWEPAYPPVYWAPWAGYALSYASYGLCWGPRVWLGSGAFSYARFDWGRRYLRYASHRPWYYHGRDWQGGTRWTHGGDRRAQPGDGYRRTRDGDRRQRQGDPPIHRASVAPSQASQGFFRPPAPTAATVTAQPTVRPAAPRYGLDGTPRMGGRRASGPTQYGAVVPEQQMQNAPTVPTGRAYVRSPQPAAVASQQHQQYAPVARAMPPQHERAMVAASPVSRGMVASVPTAPVVAAAPAARVERAPSGERAERGTGRAGRDR